MKRRREEKWQKFNLIKTTRQEPRFFLIFKEIFRHPVIILLEIFIKIWLSEIVTITILIWRMRGIESRMEPGRLRF